MRTELGERRHEEGKREEGGNGRTGNTCNESVDGGGVENGVC